MLRAGVEGLAARGKAELGDKTMVDALTPAVEALAASVGNGDDLAAGLRAAAEAAAQGREATHSAGGPQGPGELPGRAQQGAHRPGRRLGHDAGRGARGRRRVTEPR